MRALPCVVVVVPQVEKAFEHGCHVVALARERVDERVAKLPLAENVFPERAEHLRNDEKQINNKSIPDKMN